MYFEKENPNVYPVFNVACTKLGKCNYKLWAMSGNGLLLLSFYDVKQRKRSLFHCYYIGDRANSGIYIFVAKFHTPIYEQS